MKKILLAMILFVNLVSFGAIKDGIYSVEKSFTSNWKSFAKITVKEGKIIGVQYDKKDDNGELLSINTVENDKYKTKFGESFRDRSFKMTRKYLSTQNVDQIEEVKDKESLSEFKSLIKFLIQKAENGETGNYKM